MKRFTYLLISICMLTLVNIANVFAQFIPVSGEVTQFANLSCNGKIFFGWDNPSTSCVYFTASQRGAWGPVDIVQFTNNGNFSFRGMNANQITYMRLMQGDVTYAQMSTRDNNFNLTATNKMSFLAGGGEVAKFQNNQIAFYKNVYVNSGANSVRLGFNDDGNCGWIGTATNIGLYLGTAGGTNIYLDYISAGSRGTYIGMEKADVEAVKLELRNKYNLFVKKGVLSEDYAIAPISSWSDFVFNNDYRLKPLSEVEDFIKVNKHLPDVPSAREVAEEGYSQHEVNKVLLQKIEELTLYVIQQNKTIEEQNKKIEKLEKQQR